MKWSNKISTECDVAPTTFPDGAIINVKFNCSQCGNKGLIAEYVDIISLSHKTDSGKDRIYYSPNVDVICAKCKETYGVSTWCSNGGWMVRFEGGKTPKDFQYKVVKI